MSSQRGRRGDAVDLEEHQCEYPWCEGTIWRHSHITSSVVRTTGRSHDVIEGLQVTVMVAYDETEDSRPRLLLHIGDGEGELDVDVSPTAPEAVRLARLLLDGFDALTQWAGQS